MSNRGQRRARRKQFKPYRDPKYGMTNLEAIEAHRLVLGGPPVKGNLYRVGLLQGGAPGDDSPRSRKQFIGEYAGTADDPAFPGETAYRWIIRNPQLPAGMKDGTEANPFLVWPLDIWHLSPAEPGDMDRPMVAQQEGSNPIESALTKLGLGHFGRGGRA